MTFSLDSFLSEPLPIVGTIEINLWKNYPAKCGVCDTEYTRLNPKSVFNSVWCTKCGEFFDGCLDEPHIQNICYNRTSDPANVNRDVIGEFIGYGGYRTIIIKHRLLPTWCYTSHPKEGELCARFIKEEQDYLTFIQTGKSPKGMKY